MSRYVFDYLSLAIAITKEELENLKTGKQKAVLKNTRTPFKGGLKCYFYETKAGGGRGKFVAIGQLQQTRFYKDDGIMCYDCGLTAEEASNKLGNPSHIGNGIVFYISGIEEVPDPDTLSHDIRLEFLIDPPKTVTRMKK